MCRRMSACTENLTMRCYLIRDTQVTVLSTPPSKIPDNADVIESAKSLDARRFPIPRLSAILNALPGASPTKRFTDRASAVKRVWAALESLPISSTRASSKQAQMIALLSRPSGVGLDELMSATGWQAHSIRGVMSGVIRKKLGMNVVSVKDGNGRVYRIAA